MALEVETMTYAELHAVAQAVSAQMQKLDQERKAGKIALIRELMAEHGISIVELTASKKKRGPYKGAGIVKYADGDKKWTGHGRAPKWFNGALAAGKTREQLRVN